MNMIAEATKDCPREDCRLTDFGVSSTTCMGWTPTFDKYGNRTDSGDPNITTGAIKCVTCGASWNYRTQYGETALTPRDRAA